MIACASTAVTVAGDVGNDEAARVLGGAILHAGADDRRLRTEQRHGLTLHVRAHERAVCVVVLEERNERRRDRDDLLRRNVHELHARGRLFDVLFGVTADDRLGRDLARSRRPACWPAR